MSVAVERTYTPEDLLAMPEEKIYELVDGKLVSREMSVVSSWVGVGEPRQYGRGAVR